MKIHTNFAALALAGALVALPAAAQGNGKGHAMGGMGTGMGRGMGTPPVTKVNGTLTNPAGSHAIGRATIRTNSEGNKILTTSRTTHGRTKHTLTHMKKMKRHHRR